MLTLATLFACATVDLFTDFRWKWPSRIGGVCAWILAAVVVSALALLGAALVLEAFR